MHKSLCLAPPSCTCSFLVWSRETPILTAYDRELVLWRPDTLPLSPSPSSSRRILAVKGGVEIPFVRDRADHSPHDSNTLYELEPMLCSPRPKYLLLHSCSYLNCRRLWRRGHKTTEFPAAIEKAAQLDVLAQMIALQQELVESEIFYYGRIGVCFRRSLARSFSEERMFLFNITHFPDSSHDRASLLSLQLNVYSTFYHYIQDSMTTKSANNVYESKLIQKQRHYTSNTNSSRCARNLSQLGHVIPFFHNGTTAMRVVVRAFDPVNRPTHDRLPNLISLQNITDYDMSFLYAADSPERVSRSGRV